MNIKKKEFLISVLMLVAVIVLHRPVVAGQDDSICIHFVGMGGRRHIELIRSGYSLSGNLPMTLCELRKNETYRLRVDGENMEKRSGRLVTTSAGRVEVKGILSRVLIGNVLLPGLGTYYSDKKTEALVDVMSFYSSLYKFMEEERQYHHLHNRYDVLLDQYYEAETLDRAKLINYKLHRASIELNVQNRSRIRFAIASLGIYAQQILTPMLVSQAPRAEVKSDGTLVRFYGGEKSRGKAILLSVIQPGKGQFYEGKIKRGMFFSFLSSISAIMALDYHSQYDWAKYRYDMAVERFNSATTIDQKELFKDDAEKLWRDVNRSKKKRDAAYVVLGTIWGLNILDSFFMPRDTAYAQGSISYEINNEGAFLVWRF